ncbi:enolase C-terminal domain-like protein [Peribacillus simplex]|uniref:enolase C-terminal domain-like protein n=1 Tax=Peribacillus simplex TaxID=1478 RepID=UPI0016234A7C|nr:enolase C-terminal domain-like protein [Peribacillus simplex]
MKISLPSKNFIIQEQSLGIHYYEGKDILDYMKNPELFDYENGYVNIPDKPGHGVDIAEKKVKQAAETGHDWKNPIWRKEDGIIAEW